MHEDIQAGRNCRVVLRPDSPAFLEFGDEVRGCIVGRDVLNIASNDTLENLYEGRVNHMQVVVVEDSAGIDWRIPETDIEKIICN